MNTSVLYTCQELTSLYVKHKLKVMTPSMANTGLSDPAPVGHDVEGFVDDVMHMVRQEKAERFLCSEHMLFTSNFPCMCYHDPPCLLRSINEYGRHVALPHHEEVSATPRCRVNAVYNGTTWFYWVPIVIKDARASVLVNVYGQGGLQSRAN